MQGLYERFYVFIRSAFGEKEKLRLFEFIWKQYHRKIGFYISNLIPFNHSAFDDIFQEVMIKIYQNLHTFNPLSSFKSWVYRIARNHCIDYLKSKKENMYHSDEIKIQKVLDHRSPEKILIQKDLNDKIEQYLNHLDPVDREISYLRFYENMRYKEISKIVKININTVKSKARLIKKKIQEDLDS